MSNFPDIINTSLQEFFDNFLASIRTKSGAMATDFTDRLGTPVVASSSGTPSVPRSAEWEATIRVNPDGLTAYAKLKAIGVIPGALGIEGFIDNMSLGEHESSVSQGSATLVANTVEVTVPALPDGSAPVPVGATVLAMVQTPGGVPALLSAVRTDNTHITISSPGPSYGALPEASGVAAVLTAGVNATVALANAVGDRMVAVETTPGGTPGAYYGVQRVSGTTVKVTSLTTGNVLQTLDTSTVTVYNFGQSAADTSTVLWAVIRP